MKLILLGTIMLLPALASADEIDEMYAACISRAELKSCIYVGPKLKAMGNKRWRDVSRKICDLSTDYCMPPDDD